jgi:O-antigen/teichoic acid export membrane protein
VTQGAKLRSRLTFPILPAPRDRGWHRCNDIHSGWLCEQMIRPRKLIKLLVKGGLAILDQGLVTGSNFFISIVLARWLSAEQYGAYAVAFVVFLLLGMLYQSLLLEPMGVFGASAYRTCLRSYLKALLALHLFISFVIILVIGSAAGIAFRLGGTKSLAGALLGIALAGPLVLMFWLVKRAFYIQLSPGPSTVGGFLYCVLTLTGLVLAYRHRWLSPFTALLLMGIGGLGAGIPLLVYLMRGLAADVGTTTLSETWHRHWRYGQWSLASSGLAWVPVNIFYPLVSSFWGMAQAGELRALVNFSAPVGQPIAALATLLLPYATRTQEKEGSIGAGALSRRVSWGFMCATVAYWSVLLVFKEPAFRILYSGRYTGVAYLLPAIALGSIFWSGFVGPANALRAMESPASVFIAVCFASAISVAIGVPATRLLGLKGAVWAMTVSQALGFLAAVVLLRRRVHGSSRLVPVLDLATTTQVESDPTLQS